MSHLNRGNFAVYEPIFDFFIFYCKSDIPKVDKWNPGSEGSALDNLRKTFI